MTNKKAYLFMRLQPFHVGHEDLICQAQKDFEQVFIVLGTDPSHIGHNNRNPMSFEQRTKALEGYNVSIIVGKLFDGDEEWVKWVEGLLGDDGKIVCSERERNVYLRYFNDDQYQSYPIPQHFQDVSASMIREETRDFLDFLIQNVRQDHRTFINEMMKNEEFYDHEEKNDELTRESS